MKENIKCKCELCELDRDNTQQCDKLTIIEDILYWMNYAAYNDSLRRKNVIKYVAQKILENKNAKSFNELFSGYIEMTEEDFISKLKRAFDIEYLKKMLLDI